MNRFVNAVNQERNFSLTENGQLAFKSTNYSKVLDFFAVAGALRTRTEKEIEQKMAQAFAEDEMLAVKLMFYLGDVRQGLGERRTFRIALKWLANHFSEWVLVNLKLIPFYGRWDNLFILKDTPCEDAMVALVKEQLGEDTRIIGCGLNLPVSLLAKWMPSINASPETRKLGLWFCKKLGKPEKIYRQILSNVRAYLKVVETKMSANRWTDIEYSAVPSVAMTNYRKAFGHHDESGFRNYLVDVKKGKQTIHSQTLYPYNIVEKYLDYDIPDEVLELQWKNLPNYVQGNCNVLVMADVSGSMSGRPIATSVGLAIYFAERNHGPYKDLFMTFSGRPEFVKLEGDTLCEKIDNAQGADWQMNTNLAAALQEILKVAVNNHLVNDDLPKALVIISDMEIDQATNGRYTFLDQMRKEYSWHGYTLPNLIFWNVSSRQDTFLTHGNEAGIQLVSGQGVSVFKNLINIIGTTPYEAMLKYLNSERYAKISSPNS